MFDMSVARKYCFIASPSSRLIPFLDFPESWNRWSRHTSSLEIRQTRNSLKRSLHTVSMLRRDGSYESLKMHFSAGEEHDECQYHVRPPKEYTLNAALARLSHLRITQLGDDQDMSRGRDDDSSDIESGLANTRVGNNTGQGWEMDEENARKLAMLRLGCFTTVEAHLSVSPFDIYAFPYPDSWAISFAPLVLCCFSLKR